MLNAVPSVQRDLIRLYIGGLQGGTLGGLIGFSLMLDLDYYIREVTWTNVLIQLGACLAPTLIFTLIFIVRMLYHGYWRKPQSSGSQQSGSSKEEKISSTQSGSSS